ncbi:unnamed protein product [Pseudo-nitzschia multistriata]|uniref:Uncharacterized protein n=1 Tax=Pseudo-nitzschia multistriata TaxID=183589 RepID=A0A448ZKC2_9STRA|nr:unnamed protein product [Pseudo-nitzschia multistriata]VEU42508.1 unnamed protein product [Pseudo-nitzschia multistriata]
MAVQQLMKTFLLVLSLSGLCQTADALASTRTSQKIFAVEDRITEDRRIQPFESAGAEFSRRTALRNFGVASAVLFGSSAGFTKPLPAVAADDSLDAYLYKIVRVREATQQERRLITTGKFKDQQRANVKLAVKFMVQNYRLSDSVVGASGYLTGGNALQMRAIDAGQGAVQNLQTILEYFDSSDVENIKVGKNSMAGKEEIVVKGLEATQVKLDEFLGFFDDETVNKVKAKVQEENELNVKEFDRSLGDIINLAPPS